MAHPAAIGAGLMAVGMAVALLGAYQLGLARAARKWDPNDGSPRIGRGMATVGVLLGLLLVGGGAAALTLLIRIPDATPAARVGVGVTAGLVAFALGMYGCAKLADRTELSTLIRTPSRFRRLPATGTPPPTGAQPTAAEPVADPVVPPTARPGWVYRDAGGAWYLVVSAGAGHRLVSLPDFKLMPVGMVRDPITATGNVELAVWPLSEMVSASGGDTHQPAP